MPFQKYQPQSHSLSRPAKRPELSAQAARIQAKTWLQNDALSPQQVAVLELLATAGVMTTSQLLSHIPLASRSLRRYHLQHLVDHLRAPKELLKHNLPQQYRKMRLYTLGIAGQAWVELQKRQVNRYNDHRVMQVTHDVLCNEVVSALICAAEEAGYDTTWYGKLEARVRDNEHERRICVLEPDALLVLRKNRRKVAFAIELHNEDHRNRAIEKVERYEQVARGDVWRRAWPLDEFPFVLVAFHRKPVVNGYADVLTDLNRRGLACTYLARPLGQILSRHQLDTWVNLASGQNTRIIG